MFLLADDQSSDRSHKPGSSQFNSASQSYLDDHEQAVAFQ